VAEKEKRIDLNRIMSCKSMREIFMEYNFKYYRFETIEAFYAATSFDAKIQNIKIPTIFLNAADDGFSPSRGRNNSNIFPFDSIEQPFFLCNSYTGRQNNVQSKNSLDLDKIWRTSFICRGSLSFWMQLHLPLTYRLS
jgi:hypothetical protein